LTELENPLKSKKKHTRLKIYNNLVLPNLLYVFETWAITEQDK